MVIIGPDTPDAIPRLSSATPLVIHTLCRPLADYEPIPREKPLTLNKLLAKGGLSETKTILGWDIDTRRLTIALPNHKFIAWDNELKTLISSKRCPTKSLECLIGRLNHTGYIIPSARHFLSRIRYLHTKNKYNREANIPATVKGDLTLWRKFLRQARDSISLNLLTYRTPTHVYRSDACERGLGGFSKGGRAWRWEIPKHLQARAHINFLEFLASITCIKLDELEGRITPESCLLAMGDSTTATGWLRKSNFQEEDEDDHTTTAKLKAARDLAQTLIRSESMLYTQWFPGKDNLVADSLSRDLHLPPNVLTNLLSSSIPEQLPPQFSLSPLPKELDSWLSSTLAKLPANSRPLPPHKTSELEAGPAGTPSYTKLVSNTTPSSPPSHTHGPTTSSSQPLPKRCARQVSREDPSAPWWNQQSVPPLTTWHRPSGRTTNPTQDWTPPAKPRSYSSNNSKVTETPTETPNSKKLSQRVSSES